jgi:restriction endonuclease S subunit
LLHLKRAGAIDLIAGTTAQPALSLQEMNTLQIAVPPKEEQLAIVNYLDRGMARIDAIVAKIREGIEKLKEYRTALISAAVTGKIDVRDAVWNDPDSLSV